MTRAACLVVGLVLLAGACGGSGPTDDDPAPRPPERLAAAVTALAEANTGHFASQTAGSDGVPHSRIAGDYRLSPPAARLTVSRYDDGEPHDTAVIAIGRDAWSREDGAPCWTHHDVAELVDHGLLVRNGDTYAPAPVAVVGLGRGVYATHPDQISGTSRLRTVLSVADLSLPSALGLAPTADHRVPTAFTLDDGALVGWKVLVRDVVEQTRVLADTGAVGEGRLSALGALGRTIITELTHLGVEFEAVPPVAACQGRAP